MPITEGLHLSIVERPSLAELLYKASSRPNATGSSRRIAPRESTGFVYTTPTVMQAARTGPSQALSMCVT